MNLHELSGGYVNTNKGVFKESGPGAHLNRHAGAYLGSAMFPGPGTLIGALLDSARRRNNILKTREESRISEDLARAITKGTALSAALKPALRELAARSERLVELADGGDGAEVLTALKAVARAKESAAQRQMLLQRGLIEMVRGEVVINERGYALMKKAGVPPKLTPEERREEIA